MFLGRILLVALSVSVLEGKSDMPILKWLNDDKARGGATNVAMKILREDRDLSYGQGDNVLVHGDNLEALKALLPFYAGRVKCIYIDPPYNTGSAFEHYDDNLEHSQWLNMMYPRLRLLKDFLSEDGSIWISIDDDEGHYLKVICDEIFGRVNFVANVVWHKKGTRSNDARWFSDNHDHILVYARRKNDWRLNLLPRPDDSANGYSNPDGDPRGVWASGPCHAKTPNAKDIYEITTPSGRKLFPPPGTSWRFSKTKFEMLISDGRIWFGKNGDNVPRFKRFLSDVQDGFVPTTLWFREEVGDNQEAKKEVKAINEEDVFSTPKPERLIRHIITLATNPGDLVMDSFLGSGTTAAVAHKMGRRWIGIELGEHAKTHCAVRLRKVVDGEQGGISKAVGWKGGGGFRFYELGESILQKDGTLTAGIPFDVMAAHVWFSETGKPRGDSVVSGGTPSTVLGVTEDGVAYALLYNGILMDRRVDGGNILTHRTLEVIREDLKGRVYRRLVVYAEATRLMPSTLGEFNIEFKQTPYDLVTRR